MALPNDPTQIEEGNEAPQKGGSRLTIWMIMLGLGLLFLPLYLIATTIQESSAALQTELAVLQATLSFTPPPDPSEEALTEILLHAQRQSNMLESLQSTLVALHVNWPSVMAVIGAYDPAHMTLTTVTQTIKTITIMGKADDQSTISSYTDMLRKSGLFEQVAIGSIILQAVPTPSPAPTAQAAAEASPEPTMSLPPEFVNIFQITTTVKTKTG